MPDAIEQLIKGSCEIYRALIASDDKVDVESFVSRQDSIANLSPTQKRKVIASLIRCEIEIRRKRGDRIDLLEYQDRFPNFEIGFFADLFALPELPPSYTDQVSEDGTHGVLLPPRYQYSDQIGAGGIGVVYRVFDAQMTRDLAIKTLNHKFSLDWSANQRLQREAILTGRLQHPGVPPVFEQGVLPTGAHFFAMKLVEGKTFAEILASKDVNKRRATSLGVFEQVAQTIAYAHSKNVIHRDLKPQNIMVGEFGEVQVMDWGMAKSLADSQQTVRSESANVNNEGSSDVQHCETAVDTILTSVDSSLEASMGFSTKHGDVFGTPAYMSPEQARGEIHSVDHRSDVFGLGLLLFEILSGERLYQTDSPNSVIEEAAQGQYCSPKQRLHGKDVDPLLLELCVSCLAFDSQDRPANAGYVAEKVAQYQADVQDRLRQAEIEKKSAVVKSEEQSKRTRAIAWMAGLVALVSTIGAIAFAVQSQKTKLAAEKANDEFETRQEVSDFFLIDVLGSANPQIQPDRELTIREVLDSSAQVIGSRFENRPDIEIEIRSQLSEIYFGLGEYHEAKIHEQIAYDLKVQVYGEDSDEALLSYSNLAAYEVQVGNDEDAFRIFSELQPVFDTRFGVHSEKAILNQYNVAQCLYKLGRLNEAEEMVAEFIGTIKEKGILATELNECTIFLGDILGHQGRDQESDELYRSVITAANEHIVEDENGKSVIGKDMQPAFDLIQSRLGLANNMEFRGEYSESESVLRECLDESMELLGPRHLQTLGIANQVAISLLNQKRPQEAYDMLHEHVSTAEKVFGVNVGIAVDLKNTLASSVMMTGDMARAKELFLELRESLSQRYSKELHMDVITNNHNLGGIFLRLKEYEKAVASYALALEQSEELWGEENPKTILTIADLAGAQTGIGNYDAAEKGFLRSLELAQKVYPPKHPETIFTMGKLADLYVKTKQHDKAESSLRKVLELRRELNGESAISTMKVKTQLGNVLMTLKKYEEALPLLVETLNLFVELEGFSNNTALSQLIKVVDTESRLSKFESAKNRLLAAIDEVEESENSWVFWRMRSRLGRVLVDLKDYEEAEAVLTEAFGKLEKQIEIDPRTLHSELSRTSKRLIKLYGQTGDQEKEDQWRASLKELSKTPSE